MLVSLNSHVVEIQRICHCFSGCEAFCFSCHHDCWNLYGHRICSLVVSLRDAGDIRTWAIIFVELFQSHIMNSLDYYRLDVNNGNAYTICAAFSNSIYMFCQSFLETYHFVPNYCHVLSEYLRLPLTCAEMQFSLRHWWDVPYRSQCQ